jgi:hypothetical protein
MRYKMIGRDRGLVACQLANDFQNTTPLCCSLKFTAEEIIGANVTLDSEDWLSPRMLCRFVNQKAFTPYPHLHSSVVRFGRFFWRKRSEAIARPLAKVRVMGEAVESRREGVFVFSKHAHSHK